MRTLIKLGIFSGFNTGDVLYNLSAMRQSILYNSYLIPQMISNMTNQFMYEVSLAEQDWFTNLGFNHPNFFYVLPCRFNRQTSIQFLKPPFEEMFEEFHSCGSKQDVAICHGNGCGPTPQDCHFFPENSTTEYWKTRKMYMEDIHMDVEVFWLRMSYI